MLEKKILAYIHMYELSTTLQLVLFQLDMNNNLPLSLYWLP